MVLSRFLPSIGLPAEEPVRDIALQSEDLLSFAQYQQRRGETQEAAALLRHVAESDSGAVGERARAKLEALSGEGGLSVERVEVLADQFVDQVMDPVALLAMMGAGGTFQLARGGLLRVMAPLARGLSRTGRSVLSAGAGLGAFAVEATAFPIYTGLGSELFGRDFDWSRESMGHRIQGSFLVLGGLKLFGHLGSRSLQGYQAGRVPTGSFSERMLTSLVPQLSMYLGIVSGQLGERAFGLSEGGDMGQLLIESGVTLVHFNGMGRVMGAALQRGALRPPVSGRGMGALVPVYAEAMARVRGGESRGAGAEPPARAHIFMMEGNGEGSGSKPERVDPRMEAGEADAGLRQRLSQAREGDPQALAALEQGVRSGDQVALDALTLAAETQIHALHLLNSLSSQGIPQGRLRLCDLNLDHWGEQAGRDLQSLQTLIDLQMGGHLRSKEVLQALPLDFLRSQIRENSEAIMALANLHRLGHPEAGPALRAVEDLSFLLPGIEDSDSAVFALGAFALAGHEAALPLLLPLAHPETAALKVLSELALLEVPGALEGLARVAYYDNSALYSLKDLVMHRIPGALEQISEVVPRNKEALSMLVDLAFDKGFPGVIPLLAHWTARLPLARRLIYERARGGEALAYDVFSHAAPESREVQIFLAGLTSEETTLEHLARLRGGVRRFDGMDLQAELARAERNVRQAWLSLGKAAGKNSHILKFLGGLVARHPTQMGCNALALAALENPRAVYTLHRLARDLVPPYLELARQALEGLGVHMRTGIWRNKNPMTLYPLKILVTHHNPFAVRNLMERISEEDAAMEILEDLLQSSDPAVRELFREASPRSLRMVSGAESFARYQAKCRCLRQLSEWGNISAFNLLLEAVPHEESLAFSAFVQMTKNPPPALQSLLRDPALRLEPLALAAGRSAYANLVLSWLARLGNPTAQNLQQSLEGT